MSAKVHKHKAANVVCFRVRKNAPVLANAAINQKEEGPLANSAARMPATAQASSGRKGNL